MTYQPLPEELQLIAERLRAVKDRVIVEDETGWKFDLTHARVTGWSTNDPGLVLKVRKI